MRLTTVSYVIYIYVYGQKRVGDVSRGGLSALLPWQPTGDHAEMKLYDEGQ